MSADPEVAQRLSQPGHQRSDHFEIGVWFLLPDSLNLACCRFPGHRDKVLKMEPEFSNAETEVQSRVQA